MRAAVVAVQRLSARARLDDSPESIADELIARGHDVDRYELGEMYVHVELDLEVRRRLSGDVGRDRLSS
jgi:hypothetical protein